MTRITGRDKISQRAGLEADLESLRKLYRSRGYRDIRKWVPLMSMRRLCGSRSSKAAAIASKPSTSRPGSLLSTGRRRRVASECRAASMTPASIDAVDGTRRASTIRPAAIPECSCNVRDEEKAVAGAVRVMLRIDEGRLSSRGTDRRSAGTHGIVTAISGNSSTSTSPIASTNCSSNGMSATLTRLETIARVVPEIDFIARPGRADITYHIEEVDPFEYLIGGGVNGVQGGTGNGQFIAKSLLGRGDMLALRPGFRQPVPEFRRELSRSRRRSAIASSFPSTSCAPDLTYTGRDFGRHVSISPFAWAALKAEGSNSSRGIRAVQFTLASKLGRTFVPFLDTLYLGQRFRTYRVRARRSPLRAETVPFSRRAAPGFRSARSS